MSNRYEFQSKFTRVIWNEWLLLLVPDTRLHKLDCAAFVNNSENYHFHRDPKCWTFKFAAKWCFSSSNGMASWNNAYNSIAQLPATSIINMIILITENCISTNMVRKTCRFIFWRNFWIFSNFNQLPKRAIQSVTQYLECAMKCDTIL